MRGTSRRTVLGILGLSTTLVTLLIYLIIAAAPALSQNGGNGEQLFNENCAICHGAGGIGGVGPALAGGAGHLQQLGIPPAAAGPGLIKLLRAGIPGSMPDFPESKLSDADIMSIGAYLATLPPTTGENLYKSLCAKCHGVFGEGKGRIPPLAGAREFLEQLAAQMGMTFEEFMELEMVAFPGLLRTGIGMEGERTLMPVFPHLTDGEIESIGNYLLSLPPTGWEQQFFLEHGRWPTDQDRADREWSIWFTNAFGRVPTQADWEEHYWGTH